MLGFTELLILIVAAGVLFFGGKKIEEFARSLGRFAGEFKKGQREIEKELKEEIEKTSKKETENIEDFLKK